MLELHMPAMSISAMYFRPWDSHGQPESKLWPDHLLFASNLMNHRRFAIAKYVWIYLLQFWSPVSSSWAPESTPLTLPTIVCSLYGNLALASEVFLEWTYYMSAGISFTEMLSNGQVVTETITLVRKYVGWFHKPSVIVFPVLYAIKRDKLGNSGPVITDVIFLGCAVSSPAEAGYHQCGSAWNWTT